MGFIFYFIFKTTSTKSRQHKSQNRYSFVSINPLVLCDFTKASGWTSLKSYFNGRVHLIYKLMQSKVLNGLKLKNERK